MPSEFPLSHTQSVYSFATPNSNFRAYGPLFSAHTHTQLNKYAQNVVCRGEGNRIKRVLSNISPTFSQYLSYFLYHPFSLYFIPLLNNLYILKKMECLSLSFPFQIHQILSEFYLPEPIFDSIKT